MRSALLGVCLILPLAAAAQEASPEAAAPDMTGKITLTWQIDSAQDNYGFFLMRGESEQGPWVRVNEDLIPGVGTTSDVHRFTYDDTGLERGRDFWYQLWEVSYSGQEVLKGTLRAHCRTVEEDIEQERRKGYAAAIDERALGRELTTPIASGEWVIFLHRRVAQPVRLIASWRGWEEDPVELALMPDSQLLIAEEPVTAFGATGEHTYLFLVGEGASAEAELDAFNAQRASEETRGETVSVFRLAEIP